MRNHYEVLNLEKNCSAKDIKDSFIKLSKKYHPDKNKSPEAHKKFVEVNEAYSVLGKSCSRVIYDQAISHPPPYSGVVNHRSGGERTQAYEFYNPNAFGKNYKYNYENNGKWYASMKFKAIMYCCLLMAIGTGFRVLVVWKEVKKRESRSQDISKMLKEIKDRGHQLGKEEAIRELQKAFLRNKAGRTERPDQ